MSYVLAFFGTLFAVGLILDAVAYWVAHRPERDTVAEWADQMDALAEACR